MQNTPCDLCGEVLSEKATLSRMPKPSEWILKDASEYSRERWNEPPMLGHIVQSIINYLDEEYEKTDELYRIVENLKKVLSEK